MNRYKVYQTKNDCYKQGTPLTPVGILVHSTGANNPWLKRYTDGVEFFGTNVYNNHWNQPGIRKCMHGFIGKDKDGVISYVNTLPYNIACWGCGAGPKGSYNRNPTGHIQFEVQEDGLTNGEYYAEAFGAAEEICVELCKMFNIPASAITSHYEAHDLGYASNHGDPRGWMRLHDDSMSKFRARVAARLLPEAHPTPSNELYVSDRKIKVQLTRQENIDYYKVNLNDVVEVDFEQYVECVVASEIGNTFVEACKAQAVAARTFAIARTMKGSPIVDNSSAQAFRASRLNNPLYPNCRTAAIATAGQVLAYEGKAIDGAYYSDANGGNTLSSEERWGGYRPYLISQPDPWDYALSKGIINGHRVGMSQTGAKYAASIDLTYKQILSFYYPGTSILPKYGIVETTPTIPDEETEKPEDSVDTIIDMTGKFVVINTKYNAGLSIWSTRTKTYSLLKVPKGELVFVTKDDLSGWVIARKGNIQGFVDKQYLVLATPEQQAEGELLPASDDDIAPNFICYRARVNTKYDEGISLWNNTKKNQRLIRVPKGEEILVLGEPNAQWCYAEYHNVKGYADRRYLVKI